MLQRDANVPQRQDRLLTSKTTQSKLVHLVQPTGILTVVLNDIYVVGTGQKTSKRRVFRVPKWCRNYACVWARVLLDGRAITVMEASLLTVLY